MNDFELPTILSPASFTVVADDVSMADLYRSSHTCYLDEEADSERLDPDSAFGDPFDHDPWLDDEIGLVAMLASV